MMIDLATEFTVRAAPGAGADAHLYRLACTHGVSSALRLGRAGEASDQLVLALLLPGHHRATGCTCGASKPTAARRRSAGRTPALVATTAGVASR